MFIFKSTFETLKISNFSNFRYCSCDEEISIPINNSVLSSLLKRTADALVRIANQQLSVEGDKCHTVTLDQIVSTSVQLPNRGAISDKQVIDNLSIYPYFKVKIYRWRMQRHSPAIRSKFARKSSLNRTAPYWKAWCFTGFPALLIIINKAHNSRSMQLRLGFV